MAEMLDYFDSDMHWLGTADRDTVHRKGLWHQTFHCWVVRSSGELLFQRRSQDKAERAGLLDITAAGHLLAGETVEEGLRELEEEIGVRVKMEELTGLGIRLFSEMLGDKANHEFSHEFLLVDDRVLEDYVLQPEEVEGIFSASLPETTEFFAGQRDTLAMTGRVRTERGELTDVDIEAGPELFVPRIGPYYLTICIMAQRQLDGERILAI